MKLKFNKLEYQQDAINAILNVLNGTNQISQRDGYANPILEFNEINLCSLISHTQKKSELDKISKIHSFEYKPEDGLNLDIMMETGTGKTITFIETMYRLNQEYNLSKFIVIVPSNAIRSGTIKNIDITKEYFKEYGKNISVFDSKNVYGFINASNQNINVLIMTFQAFNSKNNTIHKNNVEQNLFGNATSYIDAVSSLRPIIIIDEPHRADGEKTQKFLKKFNAPLTLRFGATFNDYKNLIYSLDSAKAFRGSLVKSITVNAIGTTLNVSLEYVGNKKIKYSVGDNSKTKEVKDKDNLGSVFNDESLNAYIVDGLTSSADPKCIKFANGAELHKNEPIACDALKEEVAEAMIKEAIQSHFVREFDLFNLNIKVLSLFFIDNVDSYYKDNNKDGELAKLFERIYKQELQEMLLIENLDPEYRKYLEIAKTDVSQVHNGYFSKSNSDKDNQAQIDLILRDKEKLLSFDTPLRFIFSKWALREGWDNPNIFVLTKLSPSNSTITKLQQIGRGLRLAVDTSGNRITSEHHQFERINDLEVIIPRVEANFVQSIQDEINQNSITGKLLSFTPEDLKIQKVCETMRQANNAIIQLEELGLITVDDDYNCAVICNEDQFIKTKAKIDNQLLREFMAKMLKTNGKIKAKKRGSVETRINKDKFEKFKQLWSYINSKSTARYELDSSQLIDAIVDKLDNSLNIPPVKIISTITSKAQDKNLAQSDTNNRATINLNNNAITLKEFILQLSLKTKLTQNTIIAILQKINQDKFKSISNNFRQAIQAISEICINEIHATMINAITFDIIETNIKNTALTDNKGNLIDKINSYSLGQDLLPILELPQPIQERSLYLDYLAYDSEIEEKTIRDSNNQTITVFAKLPKINIQTPIGKYNPDFAYVLQENNSNKQAFLVLETKGYNTEQEIPKDEQNKITAGKKFFKAIQLKYPDINIKFETKINTSELSQIINEVLHTPIISKD